MTLFAFYWPPDVSQSALLLSDDGQNEQDWPVIKHTQHLDDVTSNHNNNDMDRT